MLNFSIMTLDEEHIDEVCEDIAYQVQNGIATMPLFMMTLTPEGDPVIDKAELCCRKYEKYKKKLDERGVPSGVLIQATIGHGWVSRDCFRDTSANNCIPVEHQKRADFCLPSFLFAGLFGALMELSRFENRKPEADLVVSILEFYYSAKSWLCEHEKGSVCEKVAFFLINFRVNDRLRIFFGTLRERFHGMR